MLSTAVSQREFRNSRGYCFSATQSQLGNIFERVNETTTVNAMKP